MQEICVPICKVTLSTQQEMCLCPSCVSGRVSVGVARPWPSADRVGEKNMCSPQLLRHSDVQRPMRGLFSLWQPAGGRARGPDVWTTRSDASTLALDDMTYPRGRTLVWYSILQCGECTGGFGWRVWWSIHIQCRSLRITKDFSNAAHLQTLSLNLIGCVCMSNQWWQCRHLWQCSAYGLTWLCWHRHVLSKMSGLVLTNTGAKMAGKYPNVFIRVLRILIPAVTGPWADTTMSVLLQDHNCNWPVMVLKSLRFETWAEEGIRSNLGFSVWLKDTLTCRWRELGFKPATRGIILWKNKLFFCFSYRVRYLASVQSLLRAAHEYYLMGWL